MGISWKRKKLIYITETHFLAVRLAGVWDPQWKWAADLSVHSARCAQRVSSAGRRGCCRSSVDALSTICIRSCSTARSDGGFDAGVRKQTSRGDEVADVQWQLATARWEAQWSRESAQVSWERNAKYPRLAKGMGSLPPRGKARARGDFPQLRPPVCLIQTQHAQKHRGN